jgi:riboflavin synthase
MFTGIIEAIGTVKNIVQSNTNKSFWVASPLASQLKVDQSLSHNGVCLTVEEINGDMHRVTAISETLDKTNLGNWAVGDEINLERCMQINGRLDGHIVQGHVDTTAICNIVINKIGSWEYTFTMPAAFAINIIEKGSICINGISLTIFNVTNTTFTVAIIPYTYEHTNMKYLQLNDLVNIEFDVIGKYVARITTLTKKN